MPEAVVNQIIAEIIKKTGNRDISAAINFAISSGALARDANGELVLGPRQTAATKSAAGQVVEKARAKAGRTMGMKTIPEQAAMQPTVPMNEQKAALNLRDVQTQSREVITKKIGQEAAQEAEEGVLKKWGRKLFGGGPKGLGVLDFVDVPLVENIMREGPKPRSLRGRKIEVDA